MTWKQWFLDRPFAPSPHIAKVATLAVLALLLAGFCTAVLAAAGSHWQPVWDYRETFLRGWLGTIGLSLAALVVSASIGLLLALARQSAFLFLRYASQFVVELVRGLPLLVLLLIGFYVVADRLHFENRIVAGVLVLSLFSGAYISEIFRSGMESVGESQRESARAIGLTTFQTYLFVIFPQALKVSLPPLAGQLASLIKDSSLLSILAISELTFAAQQVSSATFSTLECYIPLGVGYLALTLPIGLLTRWLETRTGYQT